MKLARITGLLLLISQLALAPTAVASASSSHGFPGGWTTTDCAAWWEDGHIDCGVWGDGSAMTMRIGIGDTPKVSFADSYASSCVNAGSPSVRWVGAGAGFYDDIFLWVNLSKTGCGVYQMGNPVSFQLYHDPGSDTLWEDEDGDGWGYVWYRTS